MEIIPGDIVLVRQKVFGTDHKITDRWELPVYKVLEKHDDRPVFTVQRIGPGSDKTIRNLHRNMLYPFISLMGDESEAEPAVEVMDPAVPAAQQDLQMASLIKANKFMDTLTRIDKITCLCSYLVHKMDSGESRFLEGCVVTLEVVYQGSSLT